VNLIKLARDEGELLEVIREVLEELDTECLRCETALKELFSASKSIKYSRFRKGGAESIRKYHIARHDSPYKRLQLRRT